MRLNDDEKAMLDGRDGPGVQRAMDLLVRYGEALGAESLVDTHNVCGTVGASTPFLRDYANGPGGMDAVFSEFNLDSPVVVKIPVAKVFSCQLIQGVDPAHWREQGVSPETFELHRKQEAYSGKIGIQLMNTCTPYQVGNVPVKGEHCAWMESSAVIYCNSVLGARTNTEGRESTGAAMLTGKIPYWGYHLDENRFGTHLVDLEVEVRSTFDWGLLGYWIGDMVQERIPVLRGVREVPNLARLKHFGAAASSSGGVEMYHMPGITPEARTVEEAFGNGKPRERLKYGAAERRAAYDKLNSTGRDTRVDYVMLGCPHYTIEQIWEACRLLEGRRIHPDCSLWIFTPRAIREIADKNGYTRIISDAGGVLMSDTCSALGQVMPKGTRVTALDSAKQAHYLPAIMGVQAWFGTTEECIDAAITGRWRGGLA
jgi:predicted aconitase